MTPHFVKLPQYDTFAFRIPGAEFALIYPASLLAGSLSQAAAYAGTECEG
jgi:hypothetical protein